MLITTALSYATIGIFYSSFSVFVRAAYKDKGGLDFETAYVLETLYLAFIALIIILSTTVRLEWAGTAFFVISSVMGVSFYIMILSLIIASSQGKISNFAYILLGFFLFLVFIPIFVNCKKIKFGVFIKGSIYSIFLAPTYINTLTIYSICNIHDISWGSRPDTNVKKIEKRFLHEEKKREINYKNYRSNFLIIWIMVNFAVAFCITRSSKNGDKSVIIGLGLFLVGLIAFKFFFCTLFILISLCKIRRSNISGEFFKRVSCSFYLNYLTFRLL